MARAVEDRFDAGGRGHERPPFERSQERHAREHRGVAREARPVRGRQPPQLAAVRGDERLVGADDGNPRLERRRDERSSRLNPAERLDDDVDRRVDDVTGVIRQRDVRPAASLGQIAHQRPRERDLTPERTQPIALALETRGNRLIDLTVPQKQNGVRFRITRNVELLTSNFELDVRHARYRPRYSGRN